MFFYSNIKPLYCVWVLLIELFERSDTLFSKLRRFYLTRDMTNLYPFIQDLLEWRFCDLFSSNVLLWNQYKYIAFSIFSWQMLIISCKMLIIIGISNEKTNELIIYPILCQNVRIFYRQELASLFQVEEKSKACRNS